MISEQSIHERVWALFAAYGAPGAVLFHISNEGIRGPRERAKFKAMGGIPGVPDFQWMARGRVGFLELKRAKGRVSDAQQDFCRQAKAQGVTTHVARSVEAAAEFLQTIGVLRADIKFQSSREPELRGAQGGAEALASVPTDQSRLEATTAA